MMQNLLLEVGDIVKLRNVALPKGARAVWGSRRGGGGYSGAACCLLAKTCEAAGRLSLCTGV